VGGYFSCAALAGAYTSWAMCDAPDDFELLVRYAREEDEAAFAVVVRRYVNLVYSAAVG
jgi:hypothetical protein